MRWPSTRFFQALGAAGFSFGFYNTISNIFQKRQNYQSMEQIRNIATEVTNIHENIERMGQVYSKGNLELKQRMIEDLYNRIEHKLNSTSNPLTDQMDIMNRAVLDYLKIQEQIDSKLQKIQFMRDQYNKLQLNNEISNLQLEAKGKIVQIHDAINTMHSNIYVAKSHILEVIEQFRRSGSNFMDPFYKYIEDFNNWFNGLDYVHSIAMINIFGTFTIIVSVFSVIAIFYGNILLDRLNLEQRYPKIAKFIMLRRKLRQYYLLWDVFLITIISIIMLAMNLTLFL